MFFMFYILVTIMYMLDVHCAIIQNSDISIYKEINTKKPFASSNRQSEPYHTIRTASFQKYFHNSKRSNNTYNLKSNIFDKMLSDEMLIIQQNLHRKDINQIPAVHISTGNDAPTPTLEVKQKWSVMNFLSNAITINESKHFTEGNNQNTTSNKINAMIKSQFGDNFNEACNNSKDKVVELRSLNDVTPDIVTSDYLENGRKCTCMNTDTHTRCSHRCTPNIEVLNSEEHSQSLSNTDHLCSRTITSIQDTQPNIPFYITTETYSFYTITPYPMYYPWVIDITKKKSKHRKNKKPPEHLDGNYYESSEENNSQESTGYDDDSIEKIKYDINTDKEEEKSEPSKGNVIINVEYEDKETLHSEKSDSIIDDILEQGAIQVSNKDKFTNQIVSDLEKYYNEVLIKDCYCSSATEIISIQNFVCMLLLFTKILQLLV